MREETSFEMYYECNLISGAVEEEIISSEKKQHWHNSQCANVNKDMRISKVWDKIRRMNVSNRIPQEWVVLLRVEANLQGIVISINQIEICIGKGNVEKTRVILESRLDH